MDWLGLLLFKELIMTPTNKLRFVERDSYSKNGEHFVMPFKIRVLQQWWSIGLAEISKDSSKVNDGEWRDVPLEKE